MIDGKPGPDEGTVYLLHLDPPFKHARHYVGWTSNLTGRLEDHRAGRGAKLLRAVREAGGTFRLARIWPGTRSLERAIKDRKDSPRLCPECTPHPRPLVTGRSAPVRARREAVPEAEVQGVPAPSAGLSDDLLALTDRLISGWRAELGLDAVAAQPETEAEHEAGIG
jgi:hypothetical protein